MRNLYKIFRSPNTKSSEKNGTEVNLQVLRLGPSGLLLLNVLNKI